MYLKLHGTPLVLFSVNLAPLTFSSLEPLLALKTAWRPSRHIDLTFLLPLSSLFSFFFPSFPLFFLFFSPPFSSFPFPFFLFGAPLVTPGGPGPQSPPQDTPLLKFIKPLKAKSKMCNFFWVVHLDVMLDGSFRIHFKKV